VGDTSWTKRRISTRWSKSARIFMRPRKEVASGARSTKNAAPASSNRVQRRGMGRIMVEPKEGTEEGEKPITYL